MRRHSTRNDLFWARFTDSRAIKATALGLVACVGLVSCGQEATIAHLVDRVSYDTLPEGKSRPPKPVENLEFAAHQLERSLYAQGVGKLSAKDRATRTAAVAAVDKHIRVVQRQFAADREKLTSLDAASALGRLDVLERRVATRAKALRSAVDALPTSGQKDVEGARDAITALQALVPRPAGQALSSDLSFKIANAPAVTPALSAGVTPAYSAPVAGQAPSSLPRTPDAADLAESPEAKVSPEVRDLAQDLDHDAVKIYAYVRNEIRFEPYLGIRKGADQTLAEKSGSSADQAALLVALLRESSIHARFVRGTAELSPTQLANLVGLDPASGHRVGAAAEILAGGGIPVQEVRANGAVVKVRFEQVWAEAYVQADAYRGVDEGTGGKRWVPLDPSIKRLHIEAPELDAPELLAPAFAELTSEFAAAGQTVAGGAGFVAPSKAVRSNQINAFLDRADTVLKHAGLPDDAQPAALLGADEIDRVDFDYLPLSLPFKPVAVAAELRTLPESLSSRVSFEVSGGDPFATPTYDPDAVNDGGLNFTARTSDLANRRITVAYVPATEEDAEIIDAYHGLLNAPTYAGRLIPVLRVDGEVVARGTQGVSTGYTQNFRITYRSPGSAPDVVENPVSVGGISAVSLNLGKKSKAQITERVERLRALAPGMTPENVLTDSRVGELLGLAGELYFTFGNVADNSTARLNQVDARRSVSGAIAATSLQTTYLAGFPVATAMTGAELDVDQDVHSVVPLTSDDESAGRYLGAYGTNASTAEADALQALFADPTVSTTKLIEKAMDDSMPIYQVNTSNIEAVAPQLSLSAYVMKDVRSAVADGATVTVHRAPVTLGGWTGTGYLIEKEGSADFRISGGRSGGGWTLDIGQGQDPNWYDDDIPTVPCVPGDLPGTPETLENPCTIPPNPKKQAVELGIWIARVLGVTDPLFLTCLAVVIDVTAIIVASFFLPAAGAPGVVGTIAVIKTVARIAYELWMVAMMYNDAMVCIVQTVRDHENGQGPRDPGP